MVSFSQISDVGGRDINEDHLRVVKADEDNWLFIAADGVGGHGGGRVASEAAALTVKEFFLGHYAGEGCLEACFEQAQNRLLQIQRDQGAPNAYKSTLTLLQIRDGRFRFGYVGDTRLYYFQDRKMIRRTVDHSAASRMAIEGKIGEEEIRLTPARNRLYCVMGSPWDENRHYETTPWYEKKGEPAFLMCTDGFWQYILEDEMEEMLSDSRGSGDWLGKMANLVRKNAPAHADNYSAITIIWD